MHARHARRDPDGRLDALGLSGRCSGRLLRPRQRAGAGSVRLPNLQAVRAGTSGQLAYTVPAGWADLQKPPTWPSADSPARLGLATLAAPDSSIDHRLLDSTGRTRRTRFLRAPLLDCPVAGLIAPVGTAGRVSLIRLESLPWPFPNGRASHDRRPQRWQVDLSMVAGFVDPCSLGQSAGGSIEYSRQIEIFGNSAQDEGIYMDSGADEHARLILLDTVDGQLVIALSAQAKPLSMRSSPRPCR